MKITAPAGAIALLEALEQAGYEAWLVGGCVRDSLLGKKAQDWDICSSATPQQLVECLSGYTVIASGLKHGTMTVLSQGQRYEVTSFRSEGEYSDYRRPDKVSFGVSLRDDLARRDFTVNAMAYHPRRGVADFFGGQADLQARLIRAVGDADKRFGEDGLRIMRALRFAAVLDFTVEPATEESILRNRALLNHIAAERLQMELVKLLAGASAPAVLQDFAKVIGEFIPEILSLVGFNQHNPWHHLDAWQHTLLALESVPADNITVRLAALFHDIGKPLCFEMGEDGVAHFYAHAQAGEKLTRQVMNRLRFDKDATHDVCQLVLYHDADIPAQPRAVRRWLNRLGQEQLRRLLVLKQADALAHNPERLQQRLAKLAELMACLEHVLEEQQCYSLSMLAINGRDIMVLGLPGGPQVGKVLKELLRLVIEGEIANEREALLAKAKDLIKSYPT